MSKQTATDIHTTKYRLMGIVFLACLCVFAVISLLLPDRELSDKERRQLQTFPEATLESVLQGNFFTKLESYLLDQFPWRDNFRSVKNSFDLAVLQKKDADGYFQIDESLYELPAESDVQALSHSAQCFNEIMELYFADSDGYYCVIPDKTAYLPTDCGYPRADYDAFMDYYAQNMSSNIQKIDISEQLTLEHYYRTDMHLRQEMLAETADLLGCSMLTMDERLRSEAYARLLSSSSLTARYSKQLISDSFYGGISSASGLYPTADNLICLTNPSIEGAIVYDYETQTEMPVYSSEKAQGLDPYDVYLGGAKALLKITNTGSTSGNELVLFRDSFGSSIAPLLLKYYDTIYLVDLRYTNASSAMSLISPKEGCDVLFLYSMNVLNSGSLRTKVL